jgi:CRISPR-associated protein (TIGR03984 family)
MTSQAMIDEVKAQCRQGTWTLFVQGYSFTGFIRFMDGKATMPPPVPGQANPAVFEDIDWDTQFDLRAFSGAGEYHAWSMTPGTWGGRFQSQEALSGKDWKRKQTILAGKLVETKDGWDRLQEANGIDYWIPGIPMNWTPRPGAKDTDPTPAAALCIAERIGFEPKNGLAGVVDAAILKIQEAKER